MVVAYVHFERHIFFLRCKEVQLVNHYDYTECSPIHTFTFYSVDIGFSDLFLVVIITKVENSSQNAVANAHQMHTLGCSLGSEEEEAKDIKMDLHKREPTEKFDANAQNLLGESMCHVVPTLPADYPRVGLEVQLIITSETHQASLLQGTF